MQSARQLVGLDPIIIVQGAIDIFAQRLGLGWHQVAAQPSPDRRQRHARDTTAALVIGSILDEERLKRREEQTFGVADAVNRLSSGADRVA